MSGGSQEEHVKPARTAVSAPPPYGAYATLLGTFLGGVAATGVLAARLGRPNNPRGVLDLLVLGLATFKTARTISHDDVTSFIREPFVQSTALSHGAEEPIRGGFKQAVGELVTCSRCIGTWAGAAIAATDVLVPRFGRTLTWALAVGGVNDWLQAGFVRVTSASNRIAS